MAKVRCPECYGKRVVLCEEYGLTYGTTDHSDVTREGPCHICGGSNKIACPECSGSGVVDED